VAVATVHEEVHQGAGKQQQEGEEAEQMRPMLGEQEKAGNGQETDENPTNPGRCSLRVMELGYCVHSIDSSRLEK
jgi:hypothetical protein